MPDDTQTRNQPPAGLRPSFDRIAGWLDSLRKVVVAVAVTAAAIIVVAAIVREFSIGGIVIEPVVVKAVDAADAPTPEVAARQIARHLDRIQRAGAQEWQRAHVDEEIHRIDLQIPGSPLSLGGAAREVVALFGGTPMTVRSAPSIGCPERPTSSRRRMTPSNSSRVCPDFMMTIIVRSPPAPTPVGHILSDHVKPP